MRVELGHSERVDDRFFEFFYYITQATDVLSHYQSLEMSTRTDSH